MQLLFTEAALKVYNKALELNRRYFLKHSYTIGSDQIFLAFIELKHPLAETFLKHFELDRNTVVRKVCQGLLPLSTESVEQNARAYFEEVARRMTVQHTRITGEWDLFLSVFEMVTSVTVVLMLRDGLHYTEIKNFLFSDQMQEVSAPYQVEQPELLPGVPPPPPSEKRLAAPRRGMSVEDRRQVSRSSSNGSILAKYGRSLTELAGKQELFPAFFRDEVLQDIMEVLCRSNQRNVLLVGETGVGKTTIVHGLTRRLREPTCPDRLKGRVVYQLNLGKLMVGANKGEFERRVHSLVEETKKDSRTIVFFEAFVQFFEDPDLNGAFQTLLPAMAVGDLQCIGAMVSEDYRKKFETSRQVARYFSAIHVRPPTPEQTIEILAKTAPRVEQYHQVKITPDAIRAAVEFAETYLKHRVLPGKAVSLLDSASARVSLASHVGHIVHREDVAEVVAREAQVPASRILATRIQSITQLEAFLTGRVIGQDAVVRTVVDTIQVNRSGLGLRNQRPDGVFLLVGPTGVGKTELAKSVSEGLTNDANKLLRFDMSEFTEKHSVAKLIGSPPGYVGHEEEGQLTSGVRANPEAVILFDEIEKADAEVTRLFLQIFDDGRLTDSHGVTADFSQTIIFMTSNLGVKDLETTRLTRMQGAERHEYLRKTLDRAVRQFFSPELINRLDDILFLDFLSPEVINRIAEKRLSEVARRVADRGIGVEITNGAFDLVVRAGYSPEFGARHLNRTIENLVLKPLAKHLLENEGTHAIKIDVHSSGDGVTFSA